MTPTLGVRQADLRKFQEDFRRLAASTQRPLHTFTNSRLWHVAEEAKRLTPVADRAKIQSDLGATIQSERVDKKGRTRRRYKYSPTPVAYAIVNWRRRNAGLPPIPRGEMASAAKKMIAGRLRAVGSMRAGWARGMAALASAFGKSGDRSGPRIKQPSTATPARPGWKPQATIEYRLTVNDGGKKIDPRVAVATDGGFRKEHGQILGQLEKQVKKSWREAGVK